MAALANYPHRRTAGRKKSWLTASLYRGIKDCGNHPAGQGFKPLSPFSGWAEFRDNLDKFPAMTFANSPRHV
jgi:hypothetical protein